MDQEQMPFKKIYQCLLAKAERKGRSQEKERSKWYVMVYSVISLLVILCLTGILCFYYTNQKKQLINNIEVVASDIMDSVVNQLTATISLAESSIRTISASVSQSMTGPELENPAKLIAPLADSSPFDAVEYIRADGMNVMSVTDPFDASDRVYYIEGIKGNTGIWNNYHPKSTKDTLMNFYTPLLYEGEPVGVITGYIRANAQIGPSLKDSLYGQKVECVLLDENGMVACSSLQTEFVKDYTVDQYLTDVGFEGEQTEKLKSLLVNETDGCIAFSNADGQGYVCAKAVPETDMLVAVIIPASSVNTVISDFMGSTTHIVIILLLILVAYFFFLIYFSSKEQKRLLAENETLEAAERQLLEKQLKLDEVSEEKDKQLRILASLSDIYYSMHLIDLRDDSVVQYKTSYNVGTIVNHRFGAVQMMKDVIHAAVTEEFLDACLEFTDITTIAERMKNRKIITGEFMGRNLGWTFMSFVMIESDSEGKPVTVMFATRGIQEEKEREEKLRKASTTDELTKLLNRRAYEEEMNAREEEIPDDLAYLAFDVNGLKSANDNLGHSAGDELIIGAAECIRNVFAPYGQVYRIGGDEFAAIITADKEQVTKIIEDFNNTAARWKGCMVSKLSISCGCVQYSEKECRSMHEMAILADKRMYLAKAEYYKLSGHDRRSAGKRAGVSAPEGKSPVQS